MWLARMSIVLLGFFATSVGAADIKMRPPFVHGCPTIQMVGEIKVGDADKLSKLIRSMPKMKNPHPACYQGAVLLNSEGGNVEEALRIGTAIRSSSFVTVVGTNDVCYSSCVLVLAGGSARLIGGAVGIHRPYFENLPNNATLGEVRSQRARLEEVIKNYLTDMDVSVRLIEDMLAVPPSQMKILSESDLNAYRLSGVDPTQNEIDVAQKAKFYGISSAEWRRRDAIAENRCGNIAVTMRVDCYHATIWGISEADFVRKKPRFTAECGALNDRWDELSKCMARIIRGS